MKKTKIIATSGPASDNKEVIKEMIESGTDIIRVNMAYASHDFLEKINKIVSELNKELNKNVSIMVDISGPSVKIGHIDDEKVISELNNALGVSFGLE